MELNDEQVMKLKLNKSIFIWIKKQAYKLYFMRYLKPCKKGPE